MKEIIIDGVDVAGCVQLVEEPSYPCGLGGECNGWENCYYKQLKHLEQENKELKEELTELEEKFLTLNGKSYSYYMTLQEIKEIAEFHITQADSEDIQEDMKQIIRLITKAEEE